MPQETTALLGARASRPPSRAARSKRLEALLDAGHGSCALCGPAAAALVEAAMLHFDGARYRLLAWAVMPNHVHVLIETADGHPVSAVVHSWKYFTAKRMPGRAPGAGRFWQPDYYDRYIRDERHYEAALAYIEANPVKASLCAAAADWPFGSARRR